MKHYVPDRKCLTTLRIIITAAVLLVIAAIRYFIPFEKTVFFLTVFLICAACFFMFLYLPKFFASIKYTASETEIIKSSGVFIKLYQSIKYSSIQYTTVINTPLSQYTGFNFIIFFVYGGQQRLLFLKQSDAEEIIRLSGSISMKEGKYVP